MRLTRHLLSPALAALALGGSVQSAGASHVTDTVALSGACAFVTLSYGPDAAAASIAASGETDCYRFEGASGDRVRLRVVRTAGALDPRATVARPDGTTVCAATTADDSDCVLDATGTHRVFVRDAAGSATGDYRISVQDLSEPVGCSNHAFATGTRTGGLAAAGETECWRFSGAAGDRVWLRLVTAAAALDPRAEVLRPDGRLLCAPTTTEDSTCVLSDGGTHTILVADTPGTDTGGYALGIQRLNNPVGCSSLSLATTATAGSLATTGEMDCWRFAGAAGDRVRVRTVETSSGLDADVDVVFPGGEALCGSSHRFVTCRIEASGTHTIVVRDRDPGTYTGNYRIAIQRLNDPVGCSSLAFGPSSHAGSLATTAETDCWRFTGAAGDRVRLRVIATAGSASPFTEVVRPDGVTRCAPTAADSTTCELDATGIHTILVEDPSGTRYGDYAVSIQRLNAPVGCSSLSYGTGALPGTIAAPAATECWRLTGAASDRVGLGAIRTWGGLSPHAEVLRPNGTTRCQPAPHRSTCLLDTAGDHTILVADSPGTGTGTGGYVISAQRVNFPVGCSGVSFGGSPATGSIGAAGETRCLRFDGAAGDRVRVHFAVTGGSTAQEFEVLRPSGTRVCGDVSTCVLDAAGTHTLLVFDDPGTGAGTFALAIQRLNNPVGCSTLPAGSSSRSPGWIGAAAEIDCWRVSGTAGQSLAVRLVETSGSLLATAEVIRPDGTTRCSRDTDDSFTCALDVTGTHTILVTDHLGLNTGGYEISNPPVVSGTIGGGG